MVNQASSFSGTGSWESVLSSVARGQDPEDMTITFLSSPTGPGYTPQPPLSWVAHQQQPLGHPHPRQATLCHPRGFLGLWNRGGSRSFEASQKQQRLGVGQAFAQAFGDGGLLTFAAAAHSGKQAAPKPRSSFPNPLWLVI